jgi:hypothetical protein
MLMPSPRTRSPYPDTSFGPSRYAIVSDRGRAAAQAYGSATDHPSRSKEQQGIGRFFTSSAREIVGRTIPAAIAGMLSNRPLTQPAHVDRDTPKGDLPPRWDVRHNLAAAA